MKSIMYHYVRPYDPKLPDLKHLHFDDFKLQLDFFESTYGFVTKEEFQNSLTTGKPSQGVILTFDDGLSCHYDFVFKELKSRNLWGIFYVPTKVYTENKMLDVHRIHLLLGIHNGETVYQHLMKLITDDMLPDMLVNEFRELTYRHQVNDNYTNLVKRILNYYISYDFREEILDSLMSALVPEDVRKPEIFYATPVQLKEMHNSEMIIGSHTVNHPVLSKLTIDKQKAEITDSFVVLHDICGDLKMKTFCYPYGGFHSFTDDTEQILDKEQCLFSFNVEHRDITQQDLTKRKQALPRYDCNQFQFGQCRVSN